MQCKVIGMVRFVQGDAGADRELEIREEHPVGGVARYFSSGRSGVWFTGLPRAGRWREILGRYALVRAHADDPMRVVEYAESVGRVSVLRVEILDRHADALLVLRHAGAPFAVHAID